MNPLRWVRWRVVGVLGVTAGFMYFLSLDEIALSKINSAGKDGRAARWSVRDIGLGLLGGNATVKDILVATPRKGGKDGSGAAPAAVTAGEPATNVEEDVLSAAGAKLDLSVSELLRRRCVVDELEVQGPKLTVTRRKDGTVNVGEIGEPPVEPQAPAPEEPGRDWVATIQKWYERIQKVREKLPERGPRERKPGVKVDYSRGAAYPFEGRPGFVVRKIAGTNFEIVFHDEASGRELPSLTNGKLEIEQVTSSPRVQEEPTRFRVSGDLAGAPLSVSGTVDLRGTRSLFAIDAVTGDLPVEVIDAFIGESLPVRLRSGSVSMDAKVLLDGRDKLEVAPRLAFKGILLEPKDPAGKIAGVNAGQFATAFNEASKEIESLVIDDLKITGSLASPRFEWGASIQNLVVSGGKAFAAKQLQKGLGQGREALTKEIEKLPVGGAVQEKLKGIDVKSLPGLPGVFGGSKEPKEKPAGEKR